MKKKLQSKIFFTILIILFFVNNIFIFAIFQIIKNSFINEIDKDLINEDTLIQSIIQTKNNLWTKYFYIPKNKLKKLNSNFSIDIKNNKNNKKIEQKIYTENKNRILIQQNDEYVIKISKNLSDFFILKNKFYKYNIFFMIFSIFIIYIIASFTARYLTKPIINIGNQVKKHNIRNYKKIKLKNSFVEIDEFVNVLNSFIEKIKKDMEKEKRFLENILHSFKTPLMQIKSSIELINIKNKNNTIQEKLDDINESTKKLDKILEEVSFVFVWKKNFKKEQICLENFIKEQISLFKVFLNEKNISVNIITKKNFCIISNNIFMEKVIWNIIENAIYYNKINWKITIIIENKKVIIKDSGIWMWKEELSQCFERFRRWKKWIEKNPKWTWLWLWIAKEICNSFFWDIKIKSEKNIWTEITIFF